MNKSFLFNITNQEGLPGGANETKSSLLGSVSISQQTSIPQFNTGGVISPGDGWEYKKEGDLYLTRRAGKENWITARGSVENAIKTKIFKETPVNTAPQINETEVKSLREYNPNNFKDKNYVIDLQTKLKKAGYDIGNYGANKDGIDGVMGSKTKAALDAFNKGINPSQVGAQQIKTDNTLSGTVRMKDPEVLPDGFLPTLTGIDQEACTEGKKCSWNTSKKMTDLFTNAGVIKNASEVWAQDAWFNRDRMTRDGGTLIYSTSERDMSKMQPVPKELYGKLQVGDYVHLNRSGSTYEGDVSSIDPSLKNEKLEHMGFIIGKDEDGTPLIWHGSEKGTAYVQRIDKLINLPDHAIPGVSPDGLVYQVASIVRNPNLKELNEDARKKIAESAYYKPLDENIKLVASDKATSTQKLGFEAVNKNFRKFKDLGYDQNDVAMVGQLLVGGIMGMESEGNEGSGYWYRTFIKEPGAYLIKDVAGQQKAFEGDQASRGVYQLKPDYNFKDKDGNLNELGKKLKKAGIEVDEIFDNVENQTIAGQILLLDNYEKLKNSEKFDKETGLYDGKIPASYMLAKTWSSGSGWWNRDKYQEWIDKFDITYSEKALEKAYQAGTLVGGTYDLKTDHDNAVKAKKRIEEQKRQETIKRMQAAAAKKKAEEAAAWEKDPEGMRQQQIETDISNFQRYQAPAESTNVYNNNSTYVIDNPFKRQEGGVTYTELTDEEIKAYREGGWIIEEM